MPDYDAMVNAWLLEKFLTSGSGISAWGSPAYDPEVHGPKEGITVLSADASWDCGCYSEYTREDCFNLEARIQVWNVDEYPPSEIRFRYGGWYDMPDFFKELDAFRETWNCSIETYEERYE